MTTIRAYLRRLITLQDSITHLNVTGQAGEPHAPDLSSSDCRNSATHCANR